MSYVREKRLERLCVVLYVIAKELMIRRKGE